MRTFTLRLEEELVSRIDQAAGDVPRARWISRAIQHELEGRRSIDVPPRIEALVAADEFRADEKAHFAHMAEVARSPLMAALAEKPAPAEQAPEPVAVPGVSWETDFRQAAAGVVPDFEEEPEIVQWLPGPRAQAHPAHCSCETCDPRSGYRCGYCDCAAPTAVPSRHAGDCPLVGS